MAELGLSDYSITQPSLEQARAHGLWALGAWDLEARRWRVRPGAGMQGCTVWVWLPSLCDRA